MKYLLAIFLSFFLLKVNAEVNNDSECFFELGTTCLSEEKYIDIFEKGYDQELIDMWNNLYNKKIKLSTKELDRLRVIAENASVLNLAPLSYRVAVVYMNIPDHKNAEIHMLKAMELGHPFGWHNVGWWHDFGFGHIKIDKKKAADIYKIAFWEFKSARSGGRLAEMYSRQEIRLSDNKNDNYKEAAKVLLKISENQEDWYEIEENDLVMANYNLGLMYRYSKGLEKDLEKSLYHFELAASRGHILAKHNLGQLLRIKFRQSKNEDFNKDAEKLYLEVVQSENTQAMAFLSLIYMEKLGIKETYEENYLKFIGWMYLANKIGVDIKEVSEAWEYESKKLKPELLEYLEYSANLCEENNFKNCFVIAK